MTVEVQTAEDLDAHDAPVRFMASVSVRFVSATFADSSVEPVYYGGAFLPPYLGSVAEDGVFEVRRDGGWPSAFSMYVAEAGEPVQAWEVANAAARTALSVVSADAGRVCRQLDDDSYWLLAKAPATWKRIDGGGAAAAPASGWRSLVDVNLTQQPAQSFIDGPQSWNGLTWYGLNVAAYTDSFAIVPGTGLVMDLNAAASDWYLSYNSGPRIYLPFSQIPGYVHGQTRVRIWMHQETNADANYETAKMGVETMPYVSGQRRLWSWLGPQTGVPTVQILDNGQERSAVYAPSAAHKVNMVEYDPSVPVALFHCKIPTAAPGAPNADEFTLRSLTYVGNWTQVEGLSAYLDNARLWKDTNGNNIAFVIGAQTVNTSNTFVCTWKRLRIEYLNPSECTTP